MSQNKYGLTHMLLTESVNTLKHHENGLLFLSTSGLHIKTIYDADKTRSPKIKSLTYYTALLEMFDSLEI